MPLSTFCGVVATVSTQAGLVAVKEPLQLFESPDSDIVPVKVLGTVCTVGCASTIDDNAKNSPPAAKVVQCFAFMELPPLNKSKERSNDVLRQSLFNVGPHQHRRITVQFGATSAPNERKPGIQLLELQQANDFQAKIEATRNQT